MRLFIIIALFSLINQASAQLCPPGSYGTSTCTPCPTGISTTGSSAGSTSVSACTICAPGYVGTVINSGTLTASGCSKGFSTDSVLALVVGDGRYCPMSPANATCNYFTAPIQLIEYNTITPGASSVQTISLPGLSISANDWYLGQMQPCADGSCAVFFSSRDCTLLKYSLFRSSKLCRRNIDPSLHQRKSCHGSNQD